MRLLDGLTITYGWIEEQFRAAILENAVAAD